MVEEKKVLIVAETEERTIAPLTFELLRAGRELSDKLEGRVCAVVLGHEVTETAEEAAFFLDKVYSVDSVLLSTFQVDYYVDAIEQLCQEINPDVVLMGHTLDNQELAPRLACRFGANLITDCVGFDVNTETGDLLCAKPVYGDNAIATFVSDKKPRMATLRPKVMKEVDRASHKGKIISFSPTLDESLARIELIETVAGDTVSLDKADAIVAGGRGVKNVEGLKELEHLIEALRKHFGKVELGASRPLIDAGWLPSHRQLGYTGEKASPQLYIAIGISGASQHLSGVIGSKKIVAINKDEDAMIFESADYGVVGDYEQVVPALAEKLKEL